jgi:S-adenosylmethionine decarboxylase
VTTPCWTHHGSTVARRVVIMLPREPFGWLLTLDLCDCEEALLISRSQIVTYVEQLCLRVLDMKRFGDPLVEWFGTNSKVTEGFSLVQLIETSSVVGHFSGHRRSAHIDVFSCKRFDPDAVASFSVRHFVARSVETRLIVRG